MPTSPEDFLSAMNQLRWEMPAIRDALASLTASVQRLDSIIPQVQQAPVPPTAQSPPQPHSASASSHRAESRASRPVPTPE